MGFFSIGKCDICGNSRALGLEKLGDNNHICRKCISYAGGYKGLLSIKPKTISAIRRKVYNTAPHNYLTDEVRKIVDSESVVTKNTTVSDNSEKCETVKGTGMQYYKENISFFAIENPDYELTAKEMSECGINRAYKYDYCATVFSFEEEPTNEFDPNAVKILANGKHVAYVKRGSCSHIKKLIAGNKIIRIQGEIYGGKYKDLYDVSDDFDDGKEHYKIVKDESPISIHLKIYVKA